MDPETGIERAARMKRARDQRQQARKSKARDGDSRSEAARARSVRRDVFIASLGGGGVVQGIAIGVTLLVVAVIAVAVIAKADLGDTGQLLLELGFAGVTIVMFFTVPDLMQGAIASVRLAWLARIGHGFDAARYRELMSDNRDAGTVVVRLELERPPSNDRQDVVDAVLGWMPSLAQASWDGEALVIRSKCIEGREWVDGGTWGGDSANRFCNVKLHRCFHGIARRVIPKLAAAAPIRRIDVDIAGDVKPWKATGRL